jgi:hypothetical protein
MVRVTLAHGNQVVYGKNWGEHSERMAACRLSDTKRQKGH